MPDNIRKDPALDGRPQVNAADVPDTKTQAAGILYDAQEKSTLDALRVDVASLGDQLAPFVHMVAEDGKVTDEERRVFHNVLRYRGVDMNREENREKADVLLDEGLARYRAAGPDQATVLAHQLAVDLRENISWIDRIRAERGEPTANEVDTWQRMETSLQPLVWAIIEDGQISTEEIGMFMAAMRAFKISSPQLNNAVRVEQYLRQEMASFFGQERNAKDQSPTAYEDERTAEAVRRLLEGVTWFGDAGDEVGYLSPSAAGAVRRRGGIDFTPL